MAAEYCLVCAAHGRKVAAVRIDYPQGDTVDWKCPICLYATTLVSKASVATVLFMFKQEIDYLVNDIELRREIEKDVTKKDKALKQKIVEDRLSKILFDDMVVIPDNRVRNLTEFNLRWLVRNLGVSNSDHKNYPEAIELIKKLLRLQQKENDNV